MLGVRRLRYTVSSGGRNPKALLQATGDHGKQMTNLILYMNRSLYRSCVPLKNASVHNWFLRHWSPNFTPGFATQLAQQSRLGQLRENDNTPLSYYSELNTISA